jgi:hypothetical protein
MTTPSEFAARLRSVGNAPVRSPDPREAQRPGAQRPGAQRPGAQRPDAQTPDVSESPPPEAAAGKSPPRQQQAEIDPVRKDLSAGLPPRTALLKVIRAEYRGHEAFQLQGYSEKERLVPDEKDLRSQLKPDFMLSRDLKNTIDSAAECYHHLLNWSTGKYALRRWIATLRRAMGDEVRLIIWDDTDFGIPWELFRLDSTGGAETEWLGVAVQVIRWTTVHDEARVDQFSAVLTQCSAGGILFYEDTTLPGAPEYAFKNQPYPGLVPANNMNDLLAKLENASNRYGLVYVRAHGVHGDSLSTAKLAGFSLGEFEWYGLPALRESSAVVFLNACNSATAVYGTPYGDGALNRNFAEAFLRRHASAVIATLAEVPADSSWALAEDFLRLAHVEGVNVAQFLQRRRAAYFNDVWRLVHSGIPSGPEGLTGRQKSAIQAFVYTSVFTYFGHPDAVLQLGA